ncbi:hypothetical protein M0R45_007395 [Rubus argutus]|uniref:Reverse transcriptase n=1 Tax=Rubus argutus TaxID=59490 RepID=A0AAW1Y0K3_RUBAR
MCDNCELLDIPTNGLSFTWSSRRTEFYGCPQFVLASKLRALKLILRDWNKTQVDKSRVRWLIDGERNTSFLHNMVKICRLNKTISSLSVGDSVLDDHEAIADHFVQHFEALFTRNPDIIDTGLVERVIPSLVTSEENSSLLKIPSSLEVHEVVKHMDGFSAPGPDGFGGCFFSHCWDIVGTDVIKVVQSFFSNGFILPHFNSSLLIFVPKSHESEEVTDFRPIALANFVFKIITRLWQID